jgi:NDP-sugar pyrophosphorylase family protein
MTNIDRMLPIAIIAGGLGTRLGSLSATLPKALVPVAGRPFIDRQIALLCESGITDVVVCAGHLGEMIEQHVGDGSRFGCRIAYSYDGATPIGTAGALAKALPLLGERFFMTYGDSLLHCDYDAIQTAFLESGKPALMTVFRNDGALVPSNVRYRNGRIEAYEKQRRSADMHYVDYGLSLFERAVFEGVPIDRPTDLAAVLQDLVSRSALAGYEVQTRFYEVGTPEGVAETEAFLRSQDAAL